MPLPETQQHVLNHLDTLTRRIEPGNVDAHTSAAIARALSISRNLANQYLNELVRRGLVVRAGAHPVYYFHKRGIERYLGHRLAEASYARLDLLLARDGDQPRHFDRAIGCEGSLLSVIDRCKAALAYPPHGLPLLLLGEEGTGKRYLTELMLAYGQDAGLFTPDATCCAIDCAAQPADASRTLQDMMPEHGGIVLFEHAEVLPAHEIDRLMQAVGVQQVGSASGGGGAFARSLPRRRPPLPPIMRRLLPVPSL